MNWLKSLFSGADVATKATDGIINGIDALIFTDEEKAKVHADADAASRAQQLKQLKLMLESQKVMNQEANPIIRLLQKLPRIVGGNAVMVRFAWNLFLLTMPEWAAAHGFAPYLPSGEMANLLMMIFGAVWMTRTIEKKIGVHNK